MSDTTRNAHSVPASFHDKTLAAFLRSVCPDLSWKKIKSKIASGTVRVGRAVITDDAYRLREGQSVSVGSDMGRKKNDREEIKKRIRLLHVDADIVVVEKPSGMTTIRHSYEQKEFGDKAKYLPETLADVLPYCVREYEKKRTRRGTPPPLKAVHRIDKETSGLLVFARNAKAAAHLGRQFKEHTITRGYKAIVVGAPESQTVRSMIARDRGDGLRGSHPTVGKTAVTHITVLKTYPACSAVECSIETGRTHQIRIHLAEAGHPVCGEPVYWRRFKRRNVKDTTEAPRLALHAALLGFVHPKTGKYCEFSSPFPPDLQRFIKKMKKMPSHGARD